MKQKGRLRVRTVRRMSTHLVWANTVLCPGMSEEGLILPAGPACRGDTWWARGLTSTLSAERLRPWSPARGQERGCCVVSALRKITLNAEGSVASAGRRRAPYAGLCSHGPVIGKKPVLSISFLSLVSGEMWFASLRALGMSYGIFLEWAKFSTGWSQNVPTTESV